MSLRAAQILLLSTKKILVINPRKNITRSFQIDSGHFIGQWYVYVYYVPYVETEEKKMELHFSKSLSYSKLHSIWQKSLQLYCVKTLHHTQV